MLKKTILVILTIGLFTLASAQNSYRKIIPFNNEWLFHLCPYHSDSYDDTTRVYFKNDFDDSSWEHVILPHDPSTKSAFSKKNSTQQQGWLPYGNGWYRKHFTIDSIVADRLIFINFEGVYRDASVYINGKFLGNKLNGYLGFRYNITPYLKFGGNVDNVIAVRYDNSHKGTSRWFTGEGIYRDVSLIETSKVYIPRNGTYVTTSLPHFSAPADSARHALVQIQTEVRNNSSLRRDIKLVTSIKDLYGNVSASAVAVAPISSGETFTFSQKIPIKDVALWDCEHPILYKAESKVYIGCEQIDYADKTGGFHIADNYTTKFGFRNIEMLQGEGMFINGKRVIAKGGDMHDNLGALGSIALKKGYLRNLLLLQKMGCNSVRLSHNPQSPLILDLADSLGILVFDEAYDTWTSQYYGGKYRFETQWKKDLKQFIRRDRNHPSVYIWSMGNEVLRQKNMQDREIKVKDFVKDYGVGIFKQMKAFTKALDPTRPVTVALFPGREKCIREWNCWDNHEKFMHTRPAEMAFYSDIVSYNYTGNNFSFDTKRYPQMLFIASETSTNMGFPLRHNSWLELNKEIIGHYYWTGIDYLGESVWPSKTWGRAFFDITGMETPLGYLYESYYSDNPMLRIFAYQKEGKDKEFFDAMKNKRWSWYPLIRNWNWEKNDTVRIQALTNADEVELFLNGKSLGTKQMKGKYTTHLDWLVPYHRGQLYAIARRDGAEVATDTLQSTTKLARIALKAETKMMKADGADLCYIRAELLDKNGNLITNNDIEINFDVTGAAKIAGVANGDIFSNEIWAGHSKMTYQGSCQVILRSSFENGIATIKASAKNIKTVELQINVK